MSPHQKNTASTPVEDDTITDRQVEQAAQDGFFTSWLLHGLTPLEEAPRMPQRNQTKDVCGFCGEYNGRLDKLGTCRDCSL